MSEREKRGAAEKSGAHAATQKELKELAQKTQNEKASPDKTSEAKRQQAIDKAREQLKSAEKQSEKTETRAETKSEKAAEHKAEQEAKKEISTEKPNEKTETKAGDTSGKRARKQAYDHTMELVRTRLTPSQQVMSRIVHSRPVEITSEVLEETLYRPSFLMGGTIGALIFGGLLYISARVYGFELSGSEFVFGILGGGIVGFVLEKIYRLFRKKPQ